ncbi:unnamed protein product [Mytilus edulis]|uniref:Uncharacterized protein n=1 Tax=Mytilus edulis TaxID=6550 RepID=A0A8S3QWV7_MYTED|nr:unnamed protein product [Mytilus edulis]
MATTLTAWGDMVTSKFYIIIIEPVTCRVIERYYDCNSCICYKRAGIWNWSSKTDRGVTIYPTHRHLYGIGWKPGLKCGFPGHPQFSKKGKPQRGMTEDILKFGEANNMSNDISEKYDIRDDQKVIPQRESNRLRKTNEVIISLMIITYRWCKVTQRKANQSVDCVMEAIAPGQGVAVKKIFLREMKNPHDQNVVQTDLVQEILQLYNVTTDNRVRRQLLALISKQLDKQELMKAIPDLTTYRIDQARLDITTAFSSGMQLLKNENIIENVWMMKSCNMHSGFFIHPLSKLCLMEPEI